MRIAQSPVPSSVRSIGTILTWIDDIQDSMVALAYATRLAAKITGKFSSQLAKKWALPLMYAEAAADALDLMRIFRAGDIAGDIARTKRLMDIEKALGAVDAKKLADASDVILSRIKVRGGVATKADIEELRLLLGSSEALRTPKMLDALSSLEQSLARKIALGVEPVLRAQRKRNVYHALESLPNLTRKQFKYLKALKGILPSFSEAVQIAQTTAQLTGYGLSLGGVVGYASDEVFGTLRGSKRKPLVKLPDLQKSLQEAQTHYPAEDKSPFIFDSREGERAAKEYQRLYKSPELTPLTMSALNIMNVGPQLMAVAGDLSVEDNLFILTAVKRAAVYLNTSRALEGWEVWAKPHLDLAIQPPPVTLRNQILINEVAPSLVRSEYMLPYMDGVSSISPRLQTSLAAPRISAGFSKWLKPLGKDMRVNYAMGLIADLASDSFGALEGEDEEMITSLTPAGKAIMRVHDYALASTLGTPPEIEKAFYSQLVDWNIRRQGSQPSYQEVSALVDLLRRLY